MRKKVEKTKLKKLYVVYSYDYTERVPVPGDENEDWPNYQDQNTSFDVHYVTKKHPDQIYVESFEVSDDVYSQDKLFLPVCRYTTGDTFGRRQGDYQMLGLFKTSEEAAEYIKFAQSDKYDGLKYWEGYFETLEGFEIYCLSVLESTKEVGNVKFKIINKVLN